jgi:hypothetical protein
MIRSGAYWHSTDCRKTFFAYSNLYNPSSRISCIDSPLSGPSAGPFITHITFLNYNRIRRNWLGQATSTPSLWATLSTHSDKVSNW